MCIKYLNVVAKLFECNIQIIELIDRIESQIVSFIQTQSLQKMSDMYKTVAWAKTAADSSFSKIEIERNVAGDSDVTFEMKYCGICHTDVHIANNDMMSTHYPCVPGHELAGVVTSVGSKVTKVKVGDRVGVGCIVDSCMNCDGCKAGEEHLCEGGMTMTYDNETKHGHIKTNTGWTFGGYSGSQTVHER